MDSQLSKTLVKRMGRIKTGDSETARWAADKILFDAMPENVKAAYLRAVKRNTQTRMESVENNSQSTTIRKAKV